MGEFSAGKSTLSNLLLGMETLPVNVTATQLPPVWISEGDAPASRVDLDQTETELPTDGFEGVSPHDTSHIRVYRQSKFLKLCDLIDMPGISDPNMAADVWQRMIHHADIVIWCSHATQAWRQSEAAVWASLPSELYQRSLLLLTRIDKITSERDRQKVVRRVRAETHDLFVECLPISLLQATSQQDDYDVWLNSGAEEFAKHFAELLNGFEVNNTCNSADTNDVGQGQQLRISGLQAPQDASAPLHPAPSEAASPIIPRRVRVSP
jgi:hypothetical protein